MYKVKLLCDRSLDKYKSKVVAKRYDQTERIDYTKTFSPVVNYVPIEVVLIIALTKNWVIRKLDVNNVFLNEDLDEKVYITQSPGLVDPKYS